MTITPPLDPRELNRLVAEKVMGWTLTRWANGNGQWTLPDGSQGPTWNTMPRFATDIACAFQVEDRIAELNLKGSYAIALHDIIRQTYAPLYVMTDTDETWDLIHATPRQRCEAALATVSTTPEE